MTRIARMVASSMSCQRLRRRRVELRITKRDAGCQDVPQTLTRKGGPNHQPEIAFLRSRNTKRGTMKARRRRRRTTKAHERYEPHEPPNPNPPNHEGTKNTKEERPTGSSHTAPAARPPLCSRTCRFPCGTGRWPCTACIPRTRGPGAGRHLAPAISPRAWPC